MSTNIDPAHGWLVVMMTAPAEVTPSGIVLPQTAIDAMQNPDSEEPPTFTVIAIPGETSAGIFQDGVNVCYPDVGTQVLVNGRNGAALKYSKFIWLVRLDAIMACVDDTAN